MIVVLVMFDRIFDNEYITIIAWIFIAGSITLDH